MARKENALDLAKFIDKGVRVKLAGGREGEQLYTGVCVVFTPVLYGAGLLDSVCSWAV